MPRRWLTSTSSAPLWVLYGILVLGGMLEMRLFPQPWKVPTASWTAVRALRANHQLVARDLRPPTGLIAAVDSAADSPVGKYLVNAKGAGDPIGSADVSGVPALRGELGAILIYPVEGKDLLLSRLLDVGDSVLPCLAAGKSSAPGTALCAKTPSGLVAVHVGKTESWVALDVSTRDSGSVLKFLFGENHFLLLARPFTKRPQ